MRRDDWLCAGRSSVLDKNVEKNASRATLPDNQPESTLSISGEADEREDLLTRLVCDSLARRPVTDQPVIYFAGPPSPKINVVLICRMFSLQWQVLTHHHSRGGGPLLSE